MTDVFASLHFLRPQWLWALLALPLLAAWWLAQRRRAGIWRAHVDPHLLPHLVEAGVARRGVGGIALRLLAVTLAVLALSGPSWRQGEAPLRQGARALVVAFDLSDAMLAPDLPPSRLLQARAWLDTFLQSRDGDVGLVAFSDDAYTVTPLTDDAANVAIFIDALAPDVMPVDGHRPERAIHAAMALLVQAGHRSGDILLMTHAADASAEAAAARASAAGIRVSVLGLGRPAGASYRARDGSLRPSRLDAASLQRVAEAGGGAYATLSAGAAGLELSGASTTSSTTTQSRATAATRTWRDDGYWLLVPLLLLGLFAFRRGSGLAVLALCMLLPIPGLHAAEPVDGTAWSRADQVEHARMRAGLEAYRAGRLDEAERTWRALPGAEAAYNRGNALARAGRLEQAIAAYDEALRQQPGMEDAIANRAVVQAALERDPPSGPGAARQDPEAGDEQSGDDASGGENAQPAQSEGEPGESGTPPPASRPQDDAGAPRRETPRAPDAPVDAQAQDQADAAQRQRMQQALDAGQDAAENGDATPGDPERAETEAERERRQAGEAWLRRVPDDPGGLLRARFRLEHERRTGNRSAP
ncbi:VWA domain-containing protein [Luteimonas kalidii]|uniref:VWA domain-containing protein n=1 Tax=Luteimonas kalidii TaxID=3042025 RepID=A0ABT6JY34_9GAMM|nr:VWA domain-containing protein [Luteimonas kalidii]MDH5835597.1 VWA domain-containing protein [Luteimonas kalidii]